MSKKRLAALVVCGVVGLLVINFAFVSGSIAILDCRAALVVDRDGCRIPSALSTGGPNWCYPELPPLSICPVTMPQTEYECSVLYRQYAMYEEHPWSYGAYRYETGRCDGVPGDQYYSKYYLDP